MTRSRFQFAGLVALLLVTPGCVGAGDARYVYQDGQYGVIGIPSNTSSWPHHYRQQADDLMKAHFPEGFEVVRAEEVVEGSRTLVLDGKTSAEVAPTLPMPLEKLGTIGRTASRTQSDTLKIKECRILYRRAGGGATEGYSEDPALEPARYLDPNTPPEEPTYDRPSVGEEQKSLLL